jgi:hypothetical protein
MEDNKQYKAYIDKQIDLFGDILFKMSHEDIDEFHFRYGYIETLKDKNKALAPSTIEKIKSSREFAKMKATGLAQEDWITVRGLIVIFIILHDMKLFSNFPHSSHTEDIKENNSHIDKQTAVFGDILSRMSHEEIDEFHFRYGYKEQMRDNNKALTDESIKRIKRGRKEADDWAFKLVQEGSDTVKDLIIIFIILHNMGRFSID